MATDEKPKVWDTARQIEALDRKIGERESVEKDLERELADYKAQTQRLKDERSEAAKEHGAVGDGYDIWRQTGTRS